MYSPDTLNAVHPKWKSWWSSQILFLLNTCDSDLIITITAQVWNLKVISLSFDPTLYVNDDWLFRFHLWDFPLVTSLAFPKYFLGLSTLRWTGLLLRPFPLSCLFCGTGRHPCSISAGFDQVPCLANRMLIGPWNVLTQMCLYSCAPVLGRLSGPAEDWHALAKWL